MALLFAWVGLLRWGAGALISVFQGFFAGVGGVVTLVVGWVLGCRCVGLCGLETFLIFPNFLRS